jgi:hypothetical protein
MIIHPDKLADRGCWISDDRVYAFVSSALSGIAEIGYHGAQPASRNVRVFSDTAGVCSFAVRDLSGGQHQLAFTAYEWSPGSLVMRAASLVGEASLEIRVGRRQVSILVTDVSGDIASFLVQFNLRSLFEDVHGRRTWSTLPAEPGCIKLQCRDQILLDEWMKREGPYGADFLIPEPLRRTIFRRKIRSGLATTDDILPEYQGAPLPIYDTTVRVDIGGDGYVVAEETSIVTFSATIDVNERAGHPFAIKFDPPADPQIRNGEVVQIPSAVQRTSSIPALFLPGFDHIQEFFSTVPGLVESCIIREFGIPRATPGGYYWIWAWDAMVTALTSLRWGGVNVAEDTVAFIGSHRDEGSIPMRWTHSLEPLDTQPRGALESLLASLAYETSRERAKTPIMEATYLQMVKHLKEIAAVSDQRGLFSNIGFYPDLPIQFGRTGESAVAMEVAAFYAFCRVCENSALQQGDQQTARDAAQILSVIERSFCQIFWDPKRNFLIDSLERKSGLRNMSYPLFNFLFLHYPPSIQLLRGRVVQSARFIGRHLLTPAGIRLLPAWDRNAGSETVSGSWYPHWDAYALKLFRKAGYSTEIMVWLRSVERALEHLGYAPEYLLLTGSMMKERSAWLRHGSASNLNCATGWYQALLDGVLGVEFDPGGLTVMPLVLPLERAEVKGIHHLGTRWNVKVRGAGPWLKGLRLDGELENGCLKVLKRHHDQGEHDLELSYGEEKPGPHFVELSNAEVLHVNSTDAGVEVGLNALGQVDLEYSAPAHWSLFLDGKYTPSARSERDDRRWASLAISGEHTLLISPRK